MSFKKIAIIGAIGYLIFNQIGKNTLDNLRFRFGGVKLNDFWGNLKRGKLSLTYKMIIQSLHRQTIIKVNNFRGHLWYGGEMVANISQDFSETLKPQETKTIQYNIESDILESAAQLVLIFKARKRGEKMTGFFIKGDLDVTVDNVRLVLPYSEQIVLEI